MKKNITLLLIIISVLYSHPTVSNLDLEQFMGRWYVIGLVPNWIEENCTNSYDDYKLNKDGTIDINYHAIKNGKKINIKQKGIVIDNKMPSKWEIKFTKPWIPFYKNTLLSTLAYSAMFYFVYELTFKYSLSYSKK